MIHAHVAGNTTAFFPVFPLAIRWVSSATTLPPLWVGVTISAVTGLTAVVAIGVLVRRFAGNEGATRATLLFALFPGTFAFSLAYNEGIVLTCIALGLIALVDAGGGWPACWDAGHGDCTDLLGLRSQLRMVRGLGRLEKPQRAPVGGAGAGGERLPRIHVLARRHTGVLNAWRLTERGGWKSSPSLSYPFRIIWDFVRIRQPDHHGPDPVLRNPRRHRRRRAGDPATATGAGPHLRPGRRTARRHLRTCRPRPRFIMLAFPLVVAYGTRLAAVPTLRPWSCRARCSLP